MRLPGQQEEEIEQEEAPPEDENVFIDNEENEEGQDEEEEEGEVEEAQEEEENEPPASVAPAFNYDSDPDMALLQETLGPEAAAALARVQARQMESMSLASVHMSAAAAENPELFRVYGARIQHSLSMLDPSLRSRPEAMNVAIASLLIEEANAKGLPAALKRLSSMAGRDATPVKVKAPKAPIPAEQRPPSPGSGRQASPPTNRRDANISYLMKAFGLDRKEAESAILDGRAV